MFKRKRKDHVVNRSHSQSAGSPASPPVTQAKKEMHAGSQITDAFRAIVEKTMEKAKDDLASTGRIMPTAFFAYPDGTMKVVSFFFKDALQKDTLVRRIREKVLEEGASAVLVLTEHERPRTAILSGTTNGIRISVLVSYGYNKETKTVASWKTTWLKEPIHDILLEGIFDKSIRQTG
ncbi:MAG: hypothetical protein C0392_03755 [Syntrophus sp. (in: bacteria)]|nr:hypothetical protein [Syntrophus sp. (in: bacteria)]